MHVMVSQDVSVKIITVNGEGACKKAEVDLVVVEGVVVILHVQVYSNIILTNIIHDGYPNRDDARLGQSWLAQAAPLPHNHKN